jgi:hypothetical protein
MTPAENPRVSFAVRFFTWVEVVVVGAAAGLWTFPELVIPFWPWQLTPFNAFFVGATYFAAWVSLIVFAWTGRWDPGRVVLPMIGAFTAYVLLISIVGWNTFLWDRPGTYAWWVLYIALPINCGIHLWLYRSWPPVSPRVTPLALRAVLLATAGAFGLYALAMLIAPEAVTGWWPWPMDAFNGRMYGVLFLTMAVGAALVARAASRLEMLTFGLTILTVGLTSLIGLVRTDIPLQRVQWGAPGTVAWLALFAFTAVLGLITVVASRAQAARLPAEAARTA